MGIAGPSGGEGGGFNPGFQLGNNIGARLMIWDGLYVNGIALLSQTEVDEDYIYSVFGNMDTGRLAVIEDLQVGVEYITQIYGTYGAYVNEIHVVTNLGRIFSAGASEGSTRFDYLVDPGQAITGFWGRCGAWLDAIGVYITPSTVL